jgi:hypothetical protein
MSTSNKAKSTTGVPVESLSPTPGAMDSATSTSPAADPSLSTLTPPPTSNSAIAKYQLMPLSAMALMSKSCNITIKLIEASMKYGVFMLFMLVSAI